MAELVAKTVSAVAVDEDLTTVIDWISIEVVSGFTIVVNNAGGGSADDVTDVQIDTSDDGGATSSLDQHDGVPAVPIASGDAEQGTFTETAKFVRVRAKCAAGEDTTVTVILLADSAIGRICTLADVKDRLGITSTGYDLVISRIISGIGSLFDTVTGRSLILNAADVTEYYKGLSSLLTVKRCPIVTITLITEALDYDFTNATALVADTDYRLTNEGKGGILYRVNVNWTSVPDSVQVVYKGGYCSAGQTPGSGETAMPNDLREAAIEQASFIFKRKDDIGLTSVAFDGGSIGKSSVMKLLPMVEQTLQHYWRPQL